MVHKKSSGSISTRKYRSKIRGTFRSGRRRISPWKLAVAALVMIALGLGGTAYVILSGPATITGNQLQLTGPGSVTVQVSQPGDATYLPAANVIQTFNAVAAAFLKYRPTSRTLFQTNATTGTTPFVLEKP